MKDYTDRVGKVIESIFEIIGSMKFAIMVFVLMIITSAAGTVLPQESADKIIYKSLWFQALLLVLVLSIIYCRLRKMPSSLKKWGSFLMHISIIIILAGCYIGYMWGDEGFLSLTETYPENRVIRDDNSTFELPFAVLLEDFMLERYDSEVIQRLDIIDKNNKIVFSKTFSNTTSFRADNIGFDIEIGMIVKDFMMKGKGEIIDKTDSWNNPAIKINVNNQEKWLFAKYPDYGNNGSEEYLYIYSVQQMPSGVKDYKSLLAIIENDHIVKEKTIEVNVPLHYKGYSFYQSSYNPKDLQWTGLMVKKDPGVSIVYFGFIILIIGLIIHTYYAIVRGKKHDN